MVCKSCIRTISLSHPLLGKTKQMRKSLAQSQCCVRAMTHLDDFYGSFYTGEKWPLLRAGLLIPPKYVALPNPFTGALQEISTELRTLGSYPLRELWTAFENQKQLKGANNNHSSQNNCDTNKGNVNSGKLHLREKRLEGIALAKQEEEMQLLYNQNHENIVDHSVGKFENHHQPQLGAFTSPNNQQPAITTRLKGMEDFLLDSSYYSGFLPSSLRELYESYTFRHVNKSTLSEFSWPPSFQPFCFEAGSNLKFPAAKREQKSGLRSYLCINGGSIFPVLALEISPVHSVLDLCAGPGTKSLLITWATMGVRSLTCNDISQSRIGRVKRLFEEFLGHVPGYVQLTQGDARASEFSLGKFDRVLADVPCLNDRASLTQPDNNIFKTSRTKERLSLIDTQKRILINALNSLRPPSSANGTAEGNLQSDDRSSQEQSVCVYSTCTLSPVENDGVVMHSLKESPLGEFLRVDVDGLMEILQPLVELQLVRIGRGKVGVVVEPCLQANFGPTYISRIVLR